MFIYLMMLDTEEEKSKFEKIYFKYRQLMFQVANGILKDECLSEDAVHESFIKIMKHLDKIKDVECSKTKGFVVIVVKNTAIDLYRKRERVNTVQIDEEVFIEHRGTTVDREVIAKIENPLTAAILSLPHHYSEIILLKYSHNYTDKQIAGLLGLSEDNVKKRLQRAKKKLKEIMKEVG
ncbi:MAG: sigma-70 family RNA polymerase sigma factor [Clostridiales bacterium]|nr:sigma-70 family RNA polymerase sigma factor [Clostridiales bacterium]MDU6975618.1 sigma-70 family RNA polymerase sigma factor [Clostridiales bacterium]